MMKRENGRVLIDISEDDWQQLLMMMGFALGKMPLWSSEFNCGLRLVNSINEGNLNFTRYEIPQEETLKP
jgi:hypothetical protein